MATFDDTIGGANANSLASVAKLDSYIEDHVHSGGDPFADTADKQKHLQHATRIIVYVLKANGQKADSAQALPFPAKGIYDQYGNEYSSLVVPEGVEFAVCELARLLKIEDLEEEPGTAGFSMMKAGPMELEVDPQDRTALIPGSVRMYLLDFGKIRDPRKGSRMIAVRRA